MIDSATPSRWSRSNLDIALVEVPLGRRHGASGVIFTERVAPMRRLPDSDTAPSPTEKLLEHIVLRWRATCGGLPLRAVVFSEGDPNHSHANAAAFASQHGGWVVQGWLVEQPRNWPMVYISSHSVVRLPSEELVDPTLPPHQLQGLGFVEHDPELVPFEDVRDRIRRRTAPLR